MIISVLLIIAMLSCAAPIASASEVVPVGSSSIAERNPENTAMSSKLILYYVLKSEIFSGRTVKFSGVTGCLMDAKEVGFTNISIQKRYGDEWVHFKSYSDDIEYNVSRCNLLIYYTAPIQGEYRINACHYVRDGNFLTGYNIDRFFNYSNYVYAI